MSELVNGNAVQRNEQQHNQSNPLNTTSNKNSSLHSGDFNRETKVVSPEEVIPLDKDSQF